MKELIAGRMLGTILLGVLDGCAQDRSPTDLTGPPATTAKAVTKAASCPSDGTPGAGAVVQGGMEVNGYCLFDHVINGDLDATASTDCPSGGFSDLDIWTAQINGKLTISGSYLGGPTVCANRITGNVVLAHVTSVHPFWLGDPDGVFGCPGNTIGGTLSVSNSLAVGAGRTLEVEANRVAG